MMSKDSQLMIHAHIATVDDDYEWYQIDDSICKRCEDFQRFQQELSLYPIDQQPLLLLSQRLDTTITLPWMVSLGPIGTPWHDRFFGRPIRIRLAIECESEESALRIFSWGLQWWSQRDSLPAPDVELATLPRQHQPAAVSEWLLDVKVREMVSVVLNDELSPVRPETITSDEQRPMFALYRESTKVQLLLWLEDYLRKLGHHSESNATNKDTYPKSKLIAAVSEGIMPQYHQFTLRALGMENFFPAEWQVHNIKDSGAQQAARRYSAKKTGVPARSINVPMSLIVKGFRYVAASIKRLKKLMHCCNQQQNVEEIGYCKGCNSRRRPL